ncbi:deoxyuridine 5'-triphosphate nucleotidohydrolase [Helicobacter sp. 13S00401-1]|uniref:dUTP diphosphatase n=1 Tax=Helicobacter sp. 13S00401-1 TaxID=1905758 RepID=UPI000BA5B1BB|nr:dUTP diphosphatase [Helicobacter sp. 13S00401-1]PAF51885.1 deoxyuridine 5'-triphosphate nucleotidohydrolase [Helicobacter sp. 13S00401-1]
MNVKIKLVQPDAKVPLYASSGASGFDLYACEDAYIESKGMALINTGIAIELTEGYEVQVRPRSGLALKHGIFVLNTPGTVDSDYRGEIKVLLANFGSEGFKVTKGDRIAQGILAPILKANFIEVKVLQDSTRGAKGFGSSGVSTINKD